MRTHVSFAVALNLSLLAAVFAGDDNQPLVVHEWGTFTVLQDHLGNAVNGVNINEESLPPFVHRLAPNLTPDSHHLAPLIGLGHFKPPVRPRGSKGIQRYYHAARMRMETPIIYLYPPQDKPERPVEVRVDFHGGWITEWYPQAKVVAPGYSRVHFRPMLNLKPSTSGSITWADVQPVDEPQLPQTDFPVWLAPRKTAAPALRAAGGEAEKYLFYRGVANLQAPLRVSREGDTLTIQTNSSSTCPIEDFDDLQLWLVDVGPQGKLQYRQVATSQRDPAPGEVIASTPASFTSAPGQGFALLREEMLAALIERGLFADEAEAMLNTWEASYFRTAGLRLFFTLPQSWTDRVLPLRVSGYETTRVVRAMIGRIELISDRQRDLLDQIAEGPVSDRSWFTNWSRANQAAIQSQVKELSAGRATLKDLGLQPPADYQAYLELGRFRDALIRHELIHPAPRTTRRDHVDVRGTLIQIRHPATAAGLVEHFTITVPGKNRVINLGEMEIYSQGQNVTAQARLSQSSNFEGKFPIKNLVDGDKNRISHTNAETDPWIKVEFDSPLSIEEVRIWNRGDYGGRFANRFDGAQVAFFAGEQRVAAVEVRTQSAGNLRTFAHNYGLPRP